MSSIKKQRKIFVLIQICIILSTIGIYLILNTKIVQFMPECIFYKKFGILCPGCGGTRFAQYLLSLDFMQALYIHPALFLLLVYLLVLDLSYAINIILKKKICLFRWWHIAFWGVLLLITTIFKNIIL